MSVERIGRKTSPPFSSFRFHSHPLIPTCTTHYCSGMEGRQNGSHPRLFRQGVTERMVESLPRNFIRKCVRNSLIEVEKPPAIDWTAFGGAAHFQSGG